MSQTRITVFGDLIEAEDLPSVVSSLFAPGRLVGNNLEVADVDLIGLTPGAVLMPDGIVVFEDESKEIVFNLSSFPADYTVLYSLQDTDTIGGSPALLELVNGLANQDDLTDATIVGWVRYPGGSVALSVSHFVQPTHLRLDTPEAKFFTEFNAPFSEAIRDEPKSGRAVKTVVFSDLTGNALKRLSLAERGRILQAFISTDNTITDDLVNYSQFNVKNGTDVLFDWSTQTTGEGALTAGTPAQMVKNTALANSLFIIEPTATLDIEVTKTGSPATSTGEIALLIELPATSGNFAESIVTLAGEYLLKVANTSLTTQTTNLTLPFAIPSGNAPSKVVARLDVDFNAIVTLSLLVDNQSVTLSPTSGQVTNTGGIATREFTVPAVSTVDWNPGDTATLKVSINAQPGRYASFAYFAITQEPTPFLLFT